MKTIAQERLGSEVMTMLDDIPTDGIVITRRGRPVARLVPMSKDDLPKGIGDLHGLLKGKVGIKGNIFSTGVKWNAESGHEYPALQPKRRVAAKRTQKSKRK